MTTKGPSMPTSTAGSSSSYFKVNKVIKIVLAQSTAAYGRSYFDYIVKAKLSKKIK